MTPGHFGVSPKHLAKIIGWAVRDNIRFADTVYNDPVNLIIGKRHDVCVVVEYIIIIQQLIIT
jgi:hypothetical protein